MANRACLPNTTLRSADPDGIRETSAARGLDFAEAATAAHRIPVAWLCFRAGDLQPFARRREPHADGEPATSTTFELPVVDLARARANLRASLPTFEAVTGETTLARA